MGRAQRPERIARVSLYAREPTWRDAVMGVLRERGWVEGRTVTFTSYSAESAEDQLGLTHLARQSRGWSL